jgi:ComF family protein
MKTNMKIYPRTKNGAIKSVFVQWYQDVINLFFPVFCHGCGVLIESQENGLICNHCYNKLEFIKKPCCPVCGLMFMKSGGGSHLCGECRSKPPFFSRAQSLVRYSDTVGKLVHTLKFKGDLSVLTTFTKWADDFSRDTKNQPDYIVPVPLHTARIRERGFNQSSLLAKQFFRAEKHKIKHLLERNINTTPQTKLGGEERRKNLLNCFRLAAGYNVKDKVIYIVDDVYTTGTTVNECAKVLIKAGARRVEVFTLAMVVKENA